MAAILLPALEEIVLLYYIYHKDNMDVGDRDKLPLRHVEPSLTAFNEVAIRYLDLLQQHEQNILKAKEIKSWTVVSKEETRALRVARQMQCMLKDLASLRSRVVAKDLAKFDAMSHVARLRTSQAIKNLTEDTIPATTARTNPVSSRPETFTRLETSPLDSDVNNLQSEAGGSVMPSQIRLRVEKQHERTLRDREAALSGWTDLANEVEDLHGMWLTMQQLAEEQGHKTTEIESHVQKTSDNVATGREHLRRAAVLKRSSLAMGGIGAGIGALIGGPVGLVAGAKVGAAVGVAGAAAGFFIFRCVYPRGRITVLKQYFSK